MALDISGRVVQLLPEQSGESSRTGNPWRKGGFVIETESNFPKKICCTVWGDLLNQVNNLKTGDKVTASIDIESREYNDRWYTDVKVWQIKPAGDSADNSGSATTAQATQPASSSSPEPPQQDDGSDDLPF